MTGTTTKADVEREMMDAWQALGSAVDSFSDAEMEQPGVVDGWSVKDLLGHIAFWAQRAAESLKPVAADRGGEIAWTGDEATVDEWNERERRLRKDRPLAEIREEWLQSFEAAMQALAALPAEMLQTEVRGHTALEWFAADTYEHYREHLAHLGAWRREVETTEA